MYDQRQAEVNILAIETATEACSVALLKPGGELFAEFEIAPRKHTSCLPKMVDSVFRLASVERSDIGCIACTHGPGAFTGVRIGAAMVQGMALGLAVPVVTVSALAALAQQACDDLDLDRVQATLDARMGEVYTGLFKMNPRSGLVEPTSPETLVTLENLQPPSGTTPVGSGYRAKRLAGLPLEPGFSLHEEVYPSAKALVRLAAQRLAHNQACSADQLQINYIRNQVAWKKAQP